MKRLFSMPAMQIALWLGAYALAGYYFGKFMLVWTSPLLAVGIRRPLMALASGFRYAVKSHVWLPVHGQHYVYRSITIHVTEDERFERWIRLADVQKVVGKTAPERALAATYPGRLKNMGSGTGMHIRDDTLLAHLKKENQPDALRFGVWVERNIVLPGQKGRQNKEKPVAKADANATGKVP